MDVKIQGYVVRFNRTNDTYSLKIGKKIFGALIGKGGDLSGAQAKEASRVLGIGGTFSLGKDSVIVTKLPGYITRLMMGNKGPADLTAGDLAAVQNMVAEVMNLPHG